MKGWVQANRKAEPLREAAGEARAQQLLSWDMVHDISAEPSGSLHASPQASLPVQGAEYQPLHHGCWLREPLGSITHHHPGMTLAELRA